MKISFGFLPVPGTVRPLSAAVEALGFDALTAADSPLLAGELHGQLMIAASATRRIEITAGVTNSVTRDASITAAAMAALQIESGGRAVCGIGRGDSAVRMIGRSPDRVAGLERYVVELRGYLSGRPVERGTASARLEWWDPSVLPPPPIEIAPSGPAMLALAGRQADRIALAVGADPEHVGNHVMLARRAVEAAGRDPDGVAYGAYVPLLVLDDGDVARREVRRIASAFAHFAKRPGGTDADAPAPLSAAASAVARELSYDSDPYRGDATTGALGAMSDEFIDWFTVAGAPDHVIARLRALAGVGVSYVHVLSGHHALDADLRERNLGLLGSVVRPAVQGEPPATTGSNAS